MSNFQLTNCQGWSNPSSSFFTPIITNLTSYYCPAGYNNLITIFGENFYSYSSVSFGTYQPTTYFINSNQIQFYVPITLGPGVYPVQVFNGAIPSNILEYTLDNSSGYWLLGGNGQISNTNSNGVQLIGNVIISGTPGVTYLQFPDGTIQTTAATNGGSFSTPITLNYTPQIIVSPSQLGYMYSGTFTFTPEDVPQNTKIIHEFTNLIPGQWLLTVNTTNFNSSQPFTASYFMSTSLINYFYISKGALTSLPTSSPLSYDLSSSLSYLLSIPSLTTFTYYFGVTLSSQKTSETTNISWNLIRVG